MAMDGFRRGDLLPAGCRSSFSRQHRSENGGGGGTKRVSRKRVFVQGFLIRGVNIGEGVHRGDPQGSQEGARRGPGWGRARDPSGSLVVAPLPFFGYSVSFLDADF